MTAHNLAATALLAKLGQSRVAKACGVTRQAVQKWRAHGIPPDRWEAVKAAFPKAPWGKYARAKGAGRGMR